MTTEICLIAPPGAALDALLAALPPAFAAAAPAALLLPRGALSDEDYARRVEAVLPPAQAAGAAVIVEGDPATARRLGADGLHVTAGVRAVRDAIAALKPDLIVGAGDVHSRHDAMQKAELGVDYILFGPLSGPISAEARDMARWWAQTMEIPSILSDPEANLAAYNAEGCEFIGIPLPEVETAP